MEKIETSDYVLEVISKGRFKISLIKVRFSKSLARKIKGCYYSSNENSWVMPQSSLSDIEQLFKVKSSELKEIVEKVLKEYKEHLILRRYSEYTIRNYYDHIKHFFDYFSEVRPYEISDEDVRTYLVEKIVNQDISYSFQKQVISAIKFYFEKILLRDKNYYKIDLPKVVARKMPKVLSKNEVTRIIDSTNNLKQRAILSTIYSAGLRLSEVVNLRITDIDSERMVLIIRAGKGKKDRNSVLSIKLLKLLREYYKIYLPQSWVFEGKVGEQYSKRNVQNLFKKALRVSKVNKDVSVHSLRHSFATHLLEDGEDLRYIQKLLGHKSIQTTEIYTHVTNVGISKIKSPFDRLGEEEDS